MLFVREVTDRVTRRLRGRMSDALSFLVATAWAEAFDFLFNVVAPEDSEHDAWYHTLLRKLFYAVVFTVLAALITEILDKDV